ncbi:GntR family transcriptional regulator [Fodinicurvata sp. EGI_FJ10296]|uniref:GntR family transcriptional regulator n=1 Tax=Fodinicurvata sp. EGI_FJ10296 TaxID=3231908 RepID=UPI0034561E95
MSATRESRPQASTRFKVTRRSLFDDVVSQLREMIVTGVLRPGDRLWEKQMCDTLGVSRTPLREALKLLAREGLVELLPNRGALVTHLSVAELDEVVEVMAPLETLIGQLAAARANAADIAEIDRRHAEMIQAQGVGELSQYFRLNQAIHERIIEATGNPSLLAVWTGFNLRIQRYRYMANLDPHRWDKAIAEHEEILDALKAGDGELLGRLLRVHLTNTAENCKLSFSQASGTEVSASPEPGRESEEGIIA